MKGIKNLIRKIKNAIIKFILLEEDYEDYYVTNQNNLTEEQSAQLYSLNVEYMKFLDVVENQIEMAHYSFFTNFIDEETYKAKQEELTTLLKEIKTSYINSMNYICLAS